MSPATWIASLSAIAPAFIDAALRGAVVLLLALALAYALRRRAAAARHLVWVGAIVVQLALPLFALWGPQWRLAVPASVATMSPVTLPTSVAVGAVPSTTTATTSFKEGTEPLLPSGRQERATPTDIATPRSPARETAPVRGNAVTGRTILLALWLLGALVILARLAIGTSIVAALARRGARVDDGSWLSLAQRTSAALHIDRPLTLLRGDRLGVPVTWGIVYPVVLLPNDADSWPEERRRFVLVHEMAHVKRLDALTQVAGQLALALFWFNPLVWIANRRMQLEREHACDDYVLRHGTAPSLYAEELLAMVRALGTPAHRTAQPAFAALAMARRSEFEGRMLSILDPVLDRHPLNKGRTLLGALAALLLIVPLAALHPYQRAAQSAIVSAPPATVPGPVAVKPVDTANDLPESFKVSILPASPAVSTPAPEVNKASPTSIAPSPAPVQKSTSSTSPSCDDIDFARTSPSTSTSIHADVSSGWSVIDFTQYNNGRCASATIIGALTYNENEDDVVGMATGSRAAFQVRTPGDDRALTIARGQDGGLQRSYRLNGQNAAFDDAARRWFASYLPRVLMETSVNVAPRVTRWRATGGATKVLDHIATMTSASAKRSHYEALLSGDALSGTDLDEVVRSAGENLRGSSSDMRAILTRAMPATKLSKRAATSLEAAVTSMASSGDKSAVLQMYGQTDDREMLLSVMRVAQTISSSGDMARLLQTLASRYLNSGDRSLLDSYFDVVERLASSGDMRNTLMIAIPYSARNPEVTRHIIHSARTVGSSGDRSQVLIALVSAGVVNTKGLLDAFMVATAELPSDADRSRVLQAAASMKP